ncbi:hypothetical protein VFPBJ_09122 [Purpureocillium lilacinum]|uniref:Uncharacterized protein n=1 Tax=Purpureocillium lilacinum TaxID=33203 RepID=A0A179GBG2_PURLI|nr:hypothetical protein VFPBJ_09122 [Purpureocillium lilacinum]GJN76452.1 hypothetical protein PLICBS_010565 [Purpureocillium lilacinum]
MKCRAPPTNEQSRGPRADSPDWDEILDNAELQREMAGESVAADLSDDTLFDDNELETLLTGETVEPLEGVGDAYVLATSDLDFDSDELDKPAASVDPVVPKAFSIREALGATRPVDLYARVLHSARDNFARRQHFQFGDLFGGPALLAGTLAD